MTADYRVVDVTARTLDAKPRCGVKNRDHPGFRRKTEWLRSHLGKGLRAKVLLTPKDVQCGYIEYIPGKYAWRRLKKYGKGLTIIRAGQCPQTIERSDAIAAMAARTFGLKARVVDLGSYRDAQNAPTPYAVFAILYNGRLVADHQVSARRFQTILKRVMAG